jgi:hypothetical protein
VLRVEDTGGGGGGGTITDIAAGPGVVVAGGAGPVATVSTGPGMSNLLYVSQNGSDVTGTGSFVLPFATYAKAAEVATADGAAGGNLYAVMFAPGTYSENLVLVPWVNLSGIDTSESVLLTGSISLSAAWTGLEGFTAVVANCDVEGAVDLDALAFSIGGFSSVEFINCAIEGTFSVQGWGSGSGDPEFTVYFVNSTVDCAIVLSDTIFITLNTSFSDVTPVGSVTLSAPTYGSRWDSEGGVVGGPIVLDGSTGQTVAATFNGTGVSSSLTLNGALATFESTVSGVPGGALSFTGGAAPAQYVISGLLPLANLTPGTASDQMLLMNGASPAWMSVTGDLLMVAPGDFRATSLESGVFIADITGALHWWYGAPSPVIHQDAYPSTSAGPGAAGQTMGLLAQPGQNATGAGNNGGQGGNLTLSSGIGGTSGAATAGDPGAVDLQVGETTTLSTGTAGVGLLLGSTTESIAGTGTTTLTPAQYLMPLIVLTGAVTGPSIVVFPNLAGLWIVDISGVTGLSALNTLTFESGSASTAPLTGTSSNLLMVSTSGANGISLNV